MRQGFTFIELLVYTTLFSVLFTGIIGTWLDVARSGANFEKLAETQEAYGFAAQKISAEINTQPDFSSAQAVLTADVWHAISRPIIRITTDSTSSVDHLTISFSPINSSSTWSLDYYHVLPQ